MDTFEQGLNKLLIDTFRRILRYEEMTVRKKYGTYLSLSELHLIESVGKDDNRPKSVGEIAQDLGITLSSVTIGVNKLERKELITKEKSGTDKRSVLVSLTETGKKENLLHQRFHMVLVRAIAGDMNEEEREVLSRGVSKLNEFFGKSIALETEDEL